MSRLSDELATQWLSTIENCWIALHISNPSLAENPADTEVQGGAYERQSMAFDLDNRVLSSKTRARFFTPDAEITYIAGWNHQYKGTMLWYTPIDGDPKLLRRGGSFFIPQGEIAISIS
jgi:hypothetical protein